MPLLKYEHPVLVSDVSKHTKKILPPLASSKETSTQSVTTQSPKLQPRRPSLQQPSPLGSHVEHPNSGQTEHNRGGDETIDSILPPKEWEDETGVWIQKVSNTPATRLDVVALQV